MSDELVIPDDLKGEYEKLLSWISFATDDLTWKDKRTVALIERIARETARADALQAQVDRLPGSGNLYVSKAAYEVLLSKVGELTARADKLAAALRVAKNYIEDLQLTDKHWSKTLDVICAALNPSAGQP